MDGERGGWRGHWRQQQTDKSTFFLASEIILPLNKGPLDKAAGSVVYDGPWERGVEAEAAAAAVEEKEEEAVE